MVNYSIHFELDIDELPRKISEEYWQIENDEFVNKPTFLGEKYNLSRHEITKIVKLNSYCLIRENCFKCKEPFESEVRTQSCFPSYKYVCTICNAGPTYQTIENPKKAIAKDIIHPQKSKHPIEKMSLPLIKRSRTCNSGELVYQNTIRFTHDIVFKADEEYVYGGWIQSDGSINLKIISIEKESKIDYMNVENDLKYAKDILQKFDNLPDAHDSNW